MYHPPPINQYYLYRLGRNNHNKQAISNWKEQGTRSKMSGRIEAMTAESAANSKRKNAPKEDEDDDSGSEAGSDVVSRPTLLYRIQTFWKQVERQKMNIGKWLMDRAWLMSISIFIT